MAKEQRHLDERGHAAAEHVDAVILLQLHDLGVHVGALGVGDLSRFLYFFLMASICGWMRCIFRPDCMVLMRSGRMTRLIRIVSQTMSQPQLLGHMLVDKRSARNSVLADDAEEAEVEQRLEVAGGQSPVGWNVAQNFNRLGAGKEARGCGRRAIADGGAQDGHLDFVLGGILVVGLDGDALAEAVVAVCLGHDELVRAGWRRWRLSGYASGRKMLAK